MHSRMVIFLTRKRLMIVFGAVVLMTLSSILLYIQLIPEPYRATAPFPEISLEDLHLELANLSPKSLHALAYELANLAKHVYIAKQHVRGSKTSKALTEATRTLTRMLPSLNLEYAHIAHRTVRKLEDVCPEVYKVREMDNPFNDTVFVTKDCFYAKSLEELITIVFVYENSQTYDVFKLLKSVRNFNSKIPIIIGTKSSQLLKKITLHFRNIKTISNYDSSSNIGAIWNSLINNVKTKYTLIAHDVIWFNHDARLDRLIRMIERLDISAAGGAFRDVNGNWFQGCQQRVRRNFTLVYKAGYDESFDECLFCDHIDGPFVMKTSEIQKFGFNERIVSQGLYEDLFVRLDKKESVVCPDAMFYTNRTERSYNPKDWESFTKVWNTYRIKFSGRDITMTTPKSYPCHNGNDRALTPWCHKENADVTHAAMDVCESLNVSCELDSGTILGAVKFHGVLPWERDSDVSFLSSQFTILANAKRTWAKMGYTVVPENTVKCCYEGSNLTKGGYIALRSKHWRLEMTGRASLASEAKAMHYQPPTMLPIDVKRARAPRNPGLWVRNRYGREVYQHAQHWGDTGDENQSYKFKRFFACHKPGNEDCLDRYNSDGNLQFKDPLV